MTRWTRRGMLWAGAIGLALAALPGGPALAAAPPPSGGTIALSPRTADGEYDPALHVFVDAMAEALTAKGFTILDDAGHAAYVAELTLSRAAVGQGVGKDPHGATVGIGAGLIVPFSTGASNAVTLERTRLEMSIRKRDEDVVWHGAAVTVRGDGSPKGQVKAVAADLGAALLQGYPAQPEDVVGVP